MASYPLRDLLGSPDIAKYGPSSRSRLRREMIAVWARNAKLEKLYEWASLFPGREREFSPDFKRRFR